MAIRAPKSVPAKRPARAARPIRPAQLNFVRNAREIISELRKVTWPSRETALNLTMVVSVTSLAVGLFLGFFDFGFSQLINNFLIPK